MLFRSPSASRDSSAGASGCACRLQQRSHCRALAPRALEADRNVRDAHGILHENVFDVVGHLVEEALLHMLVDAPSLMACGKNCPRIDGPASCTCHAMGMPEASRPVVIRAIALFAVHKAEASVAVTKRQSETCSAC